MWYNTFWCFVFYNEFCIFCLDNSLCPYKFYVWMIDIVFIDIPYLQCVDSRNQFIKSVDQNVINFFSRFVCFLFSFLKSRAGAFVFYFCCKSYENSVVYETDIYVYWQNSWNFKYLSKVFDSSTGTRTGGKCISFFFYT